jgi:hypothetical protein
MSELFLTQAEADYLFSLEKIAVDSEKIWDFSGKDDNLRIPLISVDKRESFMLDVWSSGKIALKMKYQTRCRSVFLLARIDYDGPPHQNPDGLEVGYPHIHIYKEGMGLKFAFPLPPEIFPKPEDRWNTLHNFMGYCNISKVPLFNRGLWV